MQTAIVFVRAAIAFLLALLPLIASAAVESARSATRPNFVFILADDLGWADLGCCGSTFYETPHLDRLAATGMRFTDAYAACSVCSPTRASILTGKYPARLGLTDWLPGLPDRPDQKLKRPALPDHLSLQETTLAEALREAGYQTGFIGKWHLGGTNFFPENQGFDLNVAGCQKGSPPSYFSPYRIPTLRDGPPGEYLTDRLTDEALKFISASAGKPFLLYLCHYAVHNPQQAKPGLVAKYKAKAGRLPPPNGPEFLPEGSRQVRQIQNQPVYAAMVESLDESVGRILQKLAELGLEKNTVVVFTSDNGGLSTSEGSPTSNVPLRAGKGWHYEGGVRVPLLIRWPDVTAPGSVCRAPMISTDYYPTLLEMAGLPLRPQQHVDGVSLVPLLKGGPRPERPLFWHYPHYSNQMGAPGGAVRLGNFKLIEWFEDMRVELFDVREDLGEKHDLAAQMPEKTSALRRQLHDWRQAVHAAMPEPNPDYRPHASSSSLLPAGVRFFPGPVNGVFLERNGEFLAVYGDPSDQGPRAETVLLTHARRDVTWAARGLVQRGAGVIAPEKEAELLTSPEKFWAALREKRFHDYAQQSTKVPAEPIRVSRAVKGGDIVSWSGLSIRVLDTPGYTRGAVSYLVDFGGKKLAFTGDLIRDDGKLQDLFSLQDAIPEAKVGGYHGWAGRLGELVASLDRIAAEKPDLLVPARGPVIADPQAAISRLQHRIRAAYSNYLSIDALRWYFKDDHIRAKARRVLEPGAVVEWMPLAETLPLPAAIIPISNSRLILADDRSGFLVDCGGAGILDELRKLRAAGKLTSVEHVFVTHYHDDHTDALPALINEFGAKVHACGSLIDLIERPADYRLPCLTKHPATVTAKHRDRDTWKWRGYRMTIHDFPGQTLYHNALLVEREGSWAAFFAGDSFTPSGIDDYCLQNRNFLHEGQGYLRCLAQLETLPTGCLLLNQHVGPAFRFSPGQLLQMRETLRQRIPLLAELFPFDDPNYGLDESWASLHPYWVTLRAGESAKLALRIMNHSPHERTFRAAIRTPAGLRCSSPPATTIAPGTEGRLDITLEVPRDFRPGLQVLTADVSWDGGELREWTEAVLEIGQ